MTISNGYCTLAELKGRLGISLADTGDDGALESVVNAVSRWIDRHCGRRFYSTAVDETRYYTAIDSDWLPLPDDLLSVTSLSTDSDGDRTYETTWASTDYDLEPANASLDGLPYEAIRVAPLGRYTFPTGQKGVKIVGRFGFSTATPPAITEACILACMKLWARRDAPLGIAGNGEVGQIVIPGRDRDVYGLLAPYVKMRIGAI